MNTLHPSLDNLNFGKAMDCASLTEICDLMGTTSDYPARMAMAAYGIALVATLAFAHRVFRDETLELLNHVAHAKAELDIAANHLSPVVDVTSEILLTVQHFVDQATIPCTEWPNQQETIDIICQSVGKYAIQENHSDQGKGVEPKETK